ncbi:rRNA-processing protein UTP23 homolog [Geodia barretti]|uniref:rRNA-processing protein UTP23 homolog n=1 Tax=Geodia barretti TaxID=519541 RepID=A0AA35THH6_GEOBA|nr:rRNA-processing protein UTP23 homolog [Geodia barretti]
MKVKRYKHAKKVLSFYKNTFKIREPYQVIVDGTFCQAALKGKIQIKEQLPKYLGGRVQLVTTQCVVTELEGLGQSLSGAMYVAKRFQLRNCGHHRDPQPAADCVKNMISGGNPHHYFVATQDTELQRCLRKTAGIPLLHIVGSTIVLESPTHASQKAHQDVISSKVQPTEHEKSVISALDSASGVTREPLGKRRGRKTPRGPNPLAVKKGRRKFVTTTQVHGSVVSQSKKRRARLQRKRAAELMEKVAASCIAT